ncbi:hypothetical protein Q9R19_09720 [Microbacterium sp. ARD32]|uniref:Ig-like domain-containing protein n=1 Tax=Microbacterium sp. ARD32 TaxID=2962577 RepID=UPI002881EB8B|nr:hypothetical protein [Microbacterium sp. ARD32]MDT0157900.1 hypothetical protein [Microbacterium sp. ARD32]
MSTDGEAPLTRAQLRARRAAEAARAESPDAPARPTPAESTPVDPAPADPAPDVYRRRDADTAPDTAAPDAGAQAPAQDAATQAPAVPVPTTPITTGLSLPAPEPHRRGASVPGPIRGRSTLTPATQLPATQLPAAPPSATQAPARQPRDRRFVLTLLAVLGVLALVVAVLGVVSLTQGPRITATTVDGAQAIESSGSRLTLSLNQRVDDIDAKRVTVTPAAPFTVDTAGRSIGIRFTNALDDATTYTVEIAGVVGAGGGPASDLTTTFRTPASRVLLLQRSADGDDKIFRTDLTGERATPVFEHPRIDDYRVSGDTIVVAVEEDDGSRLIAMNRDGSGRRELELPGEGFVSSVQLSDRGGYIGYSYSDRELTETSGRASVLVTEPLSGKGEPSIVQVAGEDASVAEWQFVPDSSSLLFIDFDGALGLQDLRAGTDVTSMGVAASILGVTRGTYTAIIERADGAIVQVDLTGGDETPLPASDPDYGPASEVVPFPGGTLRHVVQRDDGGMPTGQAVVRVDDEGAATVLTEVSGADAILQTCVSPSGQYAAVVVAPDLPNNPYDDMLLPLPGTLHTQLIALDGDRELPTLNGFDVSWCGQSPQP